jgi:hypothetical protein
LTEFPNTKISSELHTSLLHFEGSSSVMMLGSCVTRSNNMDLFTYFMVEIRERRLNTIASELTARIDGRETRRILSQLAEVISTSISTESSFNVAPGPATSESHVQGERHQTSHKR